MIVCLHSLAILFRELNTARLTRYVTENRFTAPVSEFRWTSDRKCEDELRSILRLLAIRDNSLFCLNFDLQTSQ